jgi:ATP-dependent Clp protease protease subunit
VKNRVVFIGTPIDYMLADLVVAELLLLQQQDAEHDIQLYINSPGGEVDAGLAIYDAMHLVQPAVATACVGSAVGISALLLAGGTRGKRAALPNARVMIHQPSTDVEGTAADIDVHAREVLRLNTRLTELLAHDSRQTVERITLDINRDFWMDAYEALAYGLIDSVVGQNGE